MLLYILYIMGKSNADRPISYIMGKSNAAILYIMGKSYIIFCKS